MRCGDCGITHEERLIALRSVVVWHVGGFFLPGVYCSGICWKRAYDNLPYRMEVATPWGA
jgi:hypothetical protein